MGYHSDLEARHMMLAKKLAEEVMDLSARIEKVEGLFLDLHTQILRVESIAECFWNEHKDLSSRLCKLETLHKSSLWEMNNGK